MDSKVSFPTNRGTASAPRTARHHQPLSSRYPGIANWPHTSVAGHLVGQMICNAICFPRSSPAVRPDVDGALSIKVCCVGVAAQKPKDWPQILFFSTTCEGDVPSPCMYTKNLVLSVKSDICSSGKRRSAQRAYRSMT